jgi:hypothetical protein
MRENAIFCSMGDDIFINDCGCGCIAPAEDGSEFCQALCGLEGACVAAEMEGAPAEEIQAETEAFMPMCLSECADDEAGASADELQTMATCFEGASGEASPGAQCEAYMLCTE